MAAIGFKSFATQNWNISPVPLATNEAPPASIKEQRWAVDLSGVGILDLQGNNGNDWRRELLSFYPNINAPLQRAISQYSIPVPPGNGFNVRADLNVDGWTIFMAPSSTFCRSAGTVDAGYAVDSWRISPLFSASTADGGRADRIFVGVEADVAVRNNKATLHRVAFRMTLTGKIVFLLSNFKSMPGMLDVSPAEAGVAVG